MRRHSLVLLMLCACGPKDGDTDDTGTAATSSASETTNTPTTGGATTGGTTGDTPTTGDELCGDPSVPISPSVEVKITNMRADRVFVDLELGCYGVHPFTILGPDAEPLKLDLFAFEFTCAEAGSGNCGEDPGCPFNGQVVQLEPGATLVSSWTGGAHTLAPLSEACAEQLCGGCWIDQQVAPGKYTVRVAAGTTLTGCDPECADCSPQDGTCTTEGARADEIVVEAVLDYPAQTAVELVIP